MPTVTKRKTKPAAAKQARKPVADRPDIPYGLKGPKEGSGLLPWSRASDRLRSSYIYWVSTTRKDGRPHSVPVWGLWLDETLYFSNGALTARNLARDPRVSREPRERRGRRDHRGRRRDRERQAADQAHQRRVQPEVSVGRHAGRRGTRCGRRSRSRGSRRAPASARRACTPGALRAGGGGLAVRGWRSEMAVDSWNTGRVLISSRVKPQME